MKEATQETKNEIETKDELNKSDPSVKALYDIVMRNDGIRFNRHGELIFVINFTSSVQFFYILPSKIKLLYFTVFCCLLLFQHMCMYDAINFCATQSLYLFCDI